MPAPIPADWSTFYANAAAQDIARGNSRTVRILLRDARRAALTFKPASYSTHNGAINP